MTNSELLLLISDRLAARAKWLKPADSTDNPAWIAGCYAAEAVEAIAEELRDLANELRDQP